MAVVISECIVKGYGKCLKVANEAAELIVTLEAGPRIIHYSLIGHENMLCQVPDMVGDNGWRILGGHRLWHSPEAMPRSYEHDDSPVDYEIVDNGVILRGAVEPYARMEKEIELHMDDDEPAVSLVHRITNRSAWAVKLAAWAITVMAPGGKEILPVTTRDTGLLSNRAVGLWPYSKMNDSRVWWGERYITIQQDEKCDGPFKLGINNEPGYVAYFNRGQVFLKQHFHDIEETYPDGGMSLETYTCSYMTEVESLSPVTELEPDETLEHVEIWTLTEGFNTPVNDDDEIDEVMDAVIEQCGGYEDCDCEGECDCGDEGCAHGDCDCGDDGCAHGTCAHHHH